MLWAGWEYIMFPSWLQVSSKALDRRLLFTGPCNTAQRRGTQIFLGHRTACSQKLGGQWEVSGLHAGEKSWALD